MDDHHLHKRGSPHPSAARASRSGREPVDIPVVALGASSGGLTACRKLVAGLPPGTGMAFILIQHLDPTHESMMVGLLAGHTSMTVCQAEEGMAIAADHLYAIPPGTTLTIRHGSLHLSEPEARRGTRMPFDDLLRSLAEQCGPKAIAVVLTGTGRDGSHGIIAVKEQGGFVIAQNPTDAEFDGMPSSAIETGYVDQVLPLADIPPALMARAAQIREAPEHAGEVSGAGPAEALTEVITLLRARTGHDFASYKPGTLHRRIERRMALVGIPTAEPVRYLRLLERDATELALLADDLLIHVTGFFRDPHVFGFLADNVIPDLVREAAEGQPLRIWVAGCSTGEEAYSLAILFREAIASSGRSIRLQIFASDIDPAAVATAREGLYPGTTTTDISPERLGRFFTRENDGYRVSAELRGDIVFTVQDVLTDPPFSRLDMISCRNVLIYLLPETQAKVVAICHFALRKGGILLLGGSEMITDADGRFEMIAKAERVFRHSVGSQPGEVELPVGAEGGTRIAARFDGGTALTRLNGLAEHCRRLVVASYAPAAVVINHRHECLYSLGPTDRYLRIAPGHPSNDIRTMARRGLAVKLRLAIDEARDKGHRVMVPGLWRGQDGSTTTFRIDVQPTVFEGQKLLLVCFVDDVPRQVRQDGTAAQADQSRVAALEQELDATRTALDDAIRDLELSGQEQKAINDEALSVNEEFQSTNEELLTSKEELQSLNEELVALNSQLHETLGQQRTTSADLQNVLYSTDVATLFLDPELRIRLFTPATTSLFRIIPVDVGRPIADLRSLAADHHLAADARAVLGGASPVEREIKAEDGRWFLRRILPYRGHDQRIEGVVTTFNDITERKRTAKDLAAAQREAEAANAAKSRFLAAASHDLRQPLQTLALIRGLLGRTVTGETERTLFARLDLTLNAMSGMLDTLLDINQIEAGAVRAETSAFPINELLSRLLDEFAYTAEAQGLVLRGVRCSLSVRSDPRLLEQMIRNLLSNAFKYTPRGKVLVGCRRRKGMLRIEIWDTGDGIDPDEQQSIFEEYYQVGGAARVTSRGLGLGLSIVQRLGRLMGHLVSVRSEPGKGSVFAIDVPRMPEVAGPLSSNERVATLAAGARPRTGRILVVEDDPELLALLAMALTGEGYSVITASDGKLALAASAGAAGPPDLVLADYNLPGTMTGLAVAAALREALDPALPAIILTGDIATATLRDVSAGDAVQLSKPVQLAELTNAIERLLALRPPTASLPPPRPAPDPRGDIARPLVNVVDDDPMVRESLCEMIQQAGFAAEGFATAEAFLAAWHPRPDACLLVDARLPGMSGLALLRRLRDEGSAVQAVMITGHGDVPMAVQAMQAGASDFIEKPVAAEVLMSSIARAMERGRDSRHHREQAEAAAAQLARLTPRQRQIMDRVLAGAPSKNIAADLGISQRTVENHRAAIMRKTEAASLPALARLAMVAASLRSKGKGPEGRAPKGEGPGGEVPEAERA